MDIQMLITFFIWFTVLNAVMFTMACLLLVFANNFVYTIHSILFSVSRETFNTVMYAFMGGYELLILFFSLAPLIVLLIITNGWFAG